jgi:hypothetical protein
MISNKLLASSKRKHFGLGFEIYDLGNGEFALSHGGSDKVFKPFSLFCQKQEVNFDFHKL